LVNHEQNSPFKNSFNDSLLSPTHNSTTYNSSPLPLHSFPNQVSAAQALSYSLRDFVHSPFSSKNFCSSRQIPWENTGKKEEVEKKDFENLLMFKTLPFNLNPLIIIALCILLINRVFHSVREQNDSEDQNGDFEFCSPISTPSLKPLSNDSVLTPSTYRSNESVNSVFHPVLVTRNSFVECVYEYGSKALYGDELRVLVDPAIPLCVLNNMKSVLSFFF
jgi:hypothetical protein